MEQPRAAAGNVLTDGSFTYTWDAESQMKTAAGVTYGYDGEGRRVSKSSGKLYWYGSGGEILAETNASGNTLNEYIFFGGRRDGWPIRKFGSEFGCPIRRFCVWGFFLRNNRLSRTGPTVHSLRFSKGAALPS